MGLRGLGGQCHIRERHDVVHVHRHTLILGGRTGHEPVHVQLGVTDLDRTDHTNGPGGGHGGRHGPHHITALIRRRRVRRHVVQTERVARGTPGERGVREVRCHLGQEPAVLRTVGDHQVVTVLGVVAHRGGRVVHDERSVGY